MALIFTDGFDAYYDSTDILSAGWSRNSALITAVMDVGRYGYGQSLATTQLTSTSQLTRSIGSNVGEFYIGFASNSSSTLDLTFYEGTTAQCAVIQSGTTLEIYRGTSTLLATSAAGVIPSGWYHIEVGGKIDSTVGWLTVKINGVTVLTFSGETNTTENAYISGIGFGGVVDDLWFCDGTVGAGVHPNNTFLGDLTVATLYPSAIDSAQFSTTAKVSLGFNASTSTHLYYAQINVCAPVDNYLQSMGAPSRRSLSSDSRYGSSPVMSVNGFLKSITINSTDNYPTAYTRGVVCEWDVASQLPIGAITYSEQIHPIVAGNNTFTFPASTVAVIKGKTYCFGFITDTILVLKSSLDASVLGFRLPADYSGRPTTWSGDLRVCSPYVEYEIEVDNAGAVQETNMDGDRGYNFSNATDAFDLFTTTAGIPSTAAIFGVSVKGQYRVDDGTRGAYNLLKSGTTTSFGVLKELTPTYALNQDVFPVNPATGATWTVGAVNAIKIGYKTGA